MDGLRSVSSDNIKTAPDIICAAYDHFGDHIYIGGSPLAFGRGVVGILQKCVLLVSRNAKVVTS